MKYALAMAVGYIIVMTWIASELVHENTKLTYDLNVSQTALIISKANAKKLYARNVELETANSCLLKAMDRPTSVKAIKSTPLPKMIKV